jgi:hypothetical protein
MRVKFLQTTPSDNPDFPFQAGQVIDITSVTAPIRAALKTGSAVILANPEDLVTATAEASERAVLPRPTRRKG